MSFSDMSFDDEFDKLDEDETIVTRTNIAGTRIWVYEALEKTRNPYDEACPHAVTRKLGGIHYGEVESLRPGNRFDDLRPGFPERYKAVKKWQQDLRELCHQIILSKYPEIEQKKFRYKGGTIEVIEIEAE